MKRPTYFKAKIQDFNKNLEFLKNVHFPFYTPSFAIANAISDEPSGNLNEVCFGVV